MPLDVDPLVAGPKFHVEGVGGGAGTGVPHADVEDDGLAEQRVLGHAGDAVDDEVRVLDRNVAVRQDVFVVGLRPLADLGLGVGDDADVVGALHGQDVDDHPLALAALEGPDLGAAQVRLAAVDVEAGRGHDVNGALVGHLDEQRQRVRIVDVPVLLPEHRVGDDEVAEDERGLGLLDGKAVVALVEFDDVAERVVDAGLDDVVALGRRPGHANRRGVRCLVRQSVDDGVVQVHAVDVEGDAERPGLAGSRVADLGDDVHGLAPVHGPRFVQVQTDVVQHEVREEQLVRIQGDGRAVVLLVGLVHQVHHVVGDDGEHVVADLGHPLEGHVHGLPGRHGLGHVDEIAVGPVDVEADAETALVRGGLADVTDGRGERHGVALGGVGGRGRDRLNDQVGARLVDGDLHLVFGHRAVVVLDDHADLVGAGVLVHVGRAHAVGPDVVAEIPHEPLEVAVLVLGAGAVELGFGLDVGGEVHAGVGERTIVDGDVRAPLGLGRVAVPQPGRERALARVLGRPRDLRPHHVQAPQVRDLDGADEGLLAAGAHVEEIEQPALGLDAVVAYDSLDDGLVALGGIDVHVEGGLDEFVRAEQRVRILRRMEEVGGLPREEVADHRVDDVELDGRRHDLLHAQGGPAVQHVRAAGRLRVPPLVHGAEFVDEVQVAVLLPEVVPGEARIRVLALAQAGDAAQVGLRHRVRQDHAHVARGLRHDHRHRPVLGRRRLRDRDRRRNRDRQPNPRVQVDQVVREAVLVAVDEREAVVRVLGVGKQVVVLDDLGRDVQDQRVDLDALVRLVGDAGREIDELAVQAARHDPVTVGRGVRGDVAQHQPHDVARLAAERTADDREIDPEAGQVLDDLRLARIDRQVRRLAVAHVLDQEAQFEGLVGQDLLRHVVVEVQLGLRVDRDPHVVRLDLLQHPVHVVGHDRLDVVGFALQVRAAEARARHQDPPRRHRAVRVQAVGAVHGRHAGHLKRDDVEAVGDVAAVGIGDPRGDREADHGLGQAARQFQARVEPLAFERGLLRDLDLDDLADRLGGQVGELESRQRHLILVRALGDLHFQLAPRFTRADRHGAPRRGIDQGDPSGKGRLFLVRLHRLRVELDVRALDQQVRVPAVQVCVVARLDVDRQGGAALGVHRSDPAVRRHRHALGPDDRDRHVVQFDQALVQDEELVVHVHLHVVRHADPRRQEGELRLRNLDLVRQRQRNLVLVLDDDRRHGPPVRQGGRHQRDLDDLGLAHRHDVGGAGDALVPRRPDVIVVRAERDVVERRDPARIGLGVIDVVVGGLPAARRGGHERLLADQRQFGVLDGAARVAVDDERQRPAFGRRDLDRQLGPRLPLAVGHDHRVDVHAERHVFGRGDHHVKRRVLARRQGRHLQPDERDPRQDGGRQDLDVRHRAHAGVRQGERPDGHLSGMQADRYPAGRQVGHRHRRIQFQRDLGLRRDPLGRRDRHREGRLVRRVLGNRDRQGQPYPGAGAQRAGQVAGDRGRDVVARVPVGQRDLDVGEQVVADVFKRQDPRVGLVLERVDGQAGGCQVGGQDGELGVAGRPVDRRHDEGVHAEVAGIAPHRVEREVNGPVLVGRGVELAARLVEETAHGLVRRGIRPALADHQEDVLEGGGLAAERRHAAGDVYGLAADVHVLVGLEGEVHLLDDGHDDVLGGRDHAVGRLDADAVASRAAALEAEGGRERAPLRVERHRDVVVNGDRLFPSLRSLLRLLDDGDEGLNGVVQAEEVAGITAAAGRRNPLRRLPVRVNQDAERVLRAARRRDLHNDVVFQGQRRGGHPLVVGLVLFVDVIADVDHAPHLERGARRRGGRPRHEERLRRMAADPPQFLGPRLGPGHVQPEQARLQRRDHRLVRHGHLEGHLLAVLDARRRNPRDVGHHEVRIQDDQVGGLVLGRVVVLVGLRDAVVAVHLDGQGVDARRGAGLDGDGRHAAGRQVRDLACAHVLAVGVEVDRKRVLDRHAARVPDRHAHVERRAVRQHRLTRQDRERVDGKVRVVEHEGRQRERPGVVGLVAFQDQADGVIGRHRQDVLARREHRLERHRRLAVDDQPGHVLAGHLLAVHVQADPEVARVGRPVVADGGGHEQRLLAADHVIGRERAGDLRHHQVREVDLLERQRRRAGVVRLVDLQDVVLDVVGHDAERVQALRRRPQERRLGRRAHLQQVVDPLIPLVLAVDVERDEEAEPRGPVALVADRGRDRHLVEFLRLDGVPGDVGHDEVGPRIGHGHGAGGLGRGAAVVGHRQVRREDARRQVVVARDRLAGRLAVAEIPVIADHQAVGVGRGGGVEGDRRVPVARQVRAGVGRRRGIDHHVADEDVVGRGDVGRGHVLEARLDRVHAAHRRRPRHREGLGVAGGHCQGLLQQRGLGGRVAHPEPHRRVGIGRPRVLDADADRVRPAAHRVGRIEGDCGDRQVRLGRRRTRGRRPSCRLVPAGVEHRDGVVIGRAVGEAGVVVRRAGGGRNAGVVARGVGGPIQAVLGGVGRPAGVPGHVEASAAAGILDRGRADRGRRRPVHDVRPLGSRLVPAVIDGPHADLPVALRQARRVPYEAAGPLPGAGRRRGTRPHVDPVRLAGHPVCEAKLGDQHVVRRQRRHRERAVGPGAVGRRDRRDLRRRLVGLRHARCLGRRGALVAVNVHRRHLVPVRQAGRHVGVDENRGGGRQERAHRLARLGLVQGVALEVVRDNRHPRDDERDFALGHRQPLGHVGRGMVHHVGLGEGTGMARRVEGRRPHLVLARRQAADVPVSVGGSDGNGGPRLAVGRVVERDLRDADVVRGRGRQVDHRGVRRPVGRRERRDDRRRHVVQRRRRHLVRVIALVAHLVEHRHDVVVRGADGRVVVHERRPGHGTVDGLVPQPRRGAAIDAIPGDVGRLRLGPREANGELDRLRPQDHRGRRRVVHHVFVRPVAGVAGRVLGAYPDLAGPVRHGGGVPGDLADRA